MYKVADGTIIHIFIECLIAQYFWVSMGIYISSPPFTYCLLQLKDLNFGISANSISWQEVFPFVLWNYWINKNRNNHNNLLLPLLITHGNKISLLKRVNWLKINIKWHKPTLGWFKLNVDVAFKYEDLQSGLSGVFRNDDGNCVVGFLKRTLSGLQFK